MRSVVVRIAAIASALSWLVFPGFGLADLGVTWSSGWEVVLEAGWGLFAAVVVGAAFGAVALRPRDCAAPLVQLWTAAAALGLSAVAGAEAPALRLVALLVVEAGVVTALARRASRNDPLARAAIAPSYVLLGLAAVGGAPWTAYAVAMYRANRASVPLDISVGVDHYAVQGALAVSLVALSVLAALWPRGRRYLGISTGLAATYLGLVSLAWPGMAGGYGSAWSVLTMLWGAGVAVLSVAASRVTAVSRSSRRPRTPAPG